MWDTDYGMKEYEYHQSWVDDPNDSLEALGNYRQYLFFGSCIDSIDQAFISSDFVGHWLENLTEHHSFFEQDSLSDFLMKTVSEKRLITLFFRQPNNQCQIAFNMFITWNPGDDFFELKGNKIRLEDVVAISSMDKEVEFPKGFPDHHMINRTALELSILAEEKPERFKATRDHLRQQLALRKITPYQSEESVRSARIMCAALDKYETSEAS